MTTISFRTAQALLVAGALFSTACAGSSPTAPSGLPGTGPAPATTSGSMPQNVTAVGTYQLVSVNGASVPGVFDRFSPRPGETMEMQAVRGRIILNDDGTYLHEWETRLTGTRIREMVSRRETVGTYSLNGGTLTLNPYQGSAYSPSYAPGRIEVVTEAPALNGGTDRFVWRFQR